MASMANIVILDGYSLNPGDLNWEPIEVQVIFTIYDRTPQNLIVERCKDAEIVLTNKVPFSSETMDMLPRLRFIAVLAAGYNIIDTKAARERGIVVSNIPSYSTPSVVQSTFSLLLAITNSVEHYTNQIVEEGRWTKCPDFCYWDTCLTELAGKRMAVYGMGSIGQRVAQVAMAFGMKVLTVSKKKASELPSGVEIVGEDEFWQTADVVTLHCPLTPETKSLINAGRISTMKDGVIILNTSRGPVVDEQAIADALKSGKIRAFGTDVLTHEPASEDHPLLQAPPVFITPHIAWATFEARTRLMKILADNVRGYINGKPVNVVN